LTETRYVVAYHLMKTKNVLLLVSALGLVLVSGCVGTVDGRHKFGVPMTSDKVVARYERPAKDIWIAAQDVIKYNGVLTSVDPLRSTLEGTVNNRTVYVKVEADDPKFTKVTTQARGSAAGDVALAAEIDKQIAIRLATGNLTPATKPARTP
jgi:hypothetical protein